MEQRSEPLEVASGGETGKSSDVGRTPGPGVTPDVVMSVEFLSAIIDHVAHPIFVKDRAYRWVLLNQAFCAMVARPREELLGRTDHDFFPKEEADFFRQKDAEMFRTGTEVVIDEERITDAVGGRHILATTKVPLRNAQGEVTHLVGIIHDISKLKHAETALREATEGLNRRVAERTAALEAAQTELVRKERLAVLGHLAASLAHQIRNPLGAIKNAAYLLKLALGSVTEPDVPVAINIIHDEVQRANRIITDLLDYSHLRPAVRRPSSIGYLVEQALGGHAIPDGVTVLTDLPELPRVDVDPGQIQSALFNLVRNAVEAMPRGGTLRVTTWQDGDRVGVSVSDTGAGISDEVKARLFEPLVTTKPLNLGLGLITARALVESQGGSIRCESAPGQGTRFEIHLPLAG